MHANQIYRLVNILYVIVYRYRKCIFENTVTLYKHDTPQSSVNRPIKNDKSDGCMYYYRFINCIAQRNQR